jgi:hypothetical protein
MMPRTISNTEQSLARASQPTSKPGGGKHHEHGQGDHALGRAILQAPGPPENPDEGWSDDKHQQQGPADAAEQGPEGSQAAAVVDQGDTERKEHPARHIVADAGSQNSDTNPRAEQVQLAENAAKHREGCDGERGANEEAEDAEANGVLGSTDKKLMVEAVGDGKAQAEGQDHAGQAHAQGCFPVLGEQTDVDLQGVRPKAKAGGRVSHLQGDQEQEDEQAQVGYIVEDGHRLGGEDGCDCQLP